MTKLISSSLDLLQAMFPGSDNVPGFVDLENKIERAVSIDNINEASSAYMAVQAQNPGLDINAILKLMKHDKTFDTAVFLNSALEVYFTAPEVVSQLTNTPVPLFPNERVLPDVNYELLEPVYIRMISE